MACRRNETKLKCPRTECSCIIFREHIATLALIDAVGLVSIEKAREGEVEQVSEFWSVTDMMQFENVGFSKDTADGKKFLICADCEVGPLGFHDTTKADKVYYIAASRTSS